MDKLKDVNYRVHSDLDKEDSYELGRFLMRSDAKPKLLIVGVWIETSDSIGQVYFKQPWRTSEPLKHYQGTIVDWMRSRKWDVHSWEWLYHE